MKSQDIDDLLKEGLSGEPPAAAFRSQALQHSTAVFMQARRTRARWHWATAGAAAILLAGISFLVGRLTVPNASVEGLEPTSQTANTAHEVIVSDELIAWLDAARLFKQLGMEERMAHALERAGRLRAYQSSPVHRSADRVVAAASDQAAKEKKKPEGLAVLPRLYEPPRIIEGVMASSLGEYKNASEDD